MPENAAYEAFQRATESLTKALTEKMTGLTTQTADVLRRLDKQTRRSTRWIIVLCVTLLLTLGGLAWTASTVHRVDSSQHKIAAIEKRLSKRSQVLCPLYTLIIQSDTPDAKAFAKKTESPEQFAQRDHAFQVIRQGYTDLGCLPKLDQNGHIPSGSTPPATKPPGK